jgi:hypothetical protein
MAKQRYFSTVVLLPESRKIVLPAFGPVKPVSPEFRGEPPESAEAEKQGQPTEKAAEEIQWQKIQEKKPQIKAEKIPELASLRFRPKRPLFTISFGYGPSLGGVGGFLQLNSKAGISLHGGVGYYPTGVFYPDFEWVKGEVLYSVGVKYYLPWNTEQVRPYLDLQYGGLSVEAVQVVTGMWYYSYVYENFQKTLRGPSLLAGMELKLGLIGLNSALGLSYVTTEWEYWDQKVFLTADVGILVYF